MSTIENLPRHMNTGSPAYDVGVAGLLSAGRKKGHLCSTARQTDLQGLTLYRPFPAQWGSNDAHTQRLYASWKSRDKKKLLHEPILKKTIHETLLCSKMRHNYACKNCITCWGTKCMKIIIPMWSEWGTWGFTFHLTKFYMESKKCSFRCRHESYM